MDEKGFLMGLAAKAKVLCRRGRRNPRVTHDGKRELVTVVETICANGSALTPFIVNKGAGHYLGWYRNLTEKEKDYRFGYSPKGWIDDYLALKWLEDVFDPQSAKIVGDLKLPRLLIFDGHGSHVTYQFVEYCIQRNILLLCLPSHSTHLLQPLDVGLFSPYQHFYGLAVDNYLRSGQNREGIKKAAFIPFLSFARSQTFQSSTVQRAFTATGIWPLNPRRVLGKVAPLSPRRRDTLGVVKHLRTGRDIRQRVKASETLLLEGIEGLTISAGGQKALERVKVLVRDLGHQLEMEIAEKEIYQEMNERLQGTETIYNTTDRRKLSVARYLDGRALISLRDARLAKDKRKEEATAKGRKGGRQKHAAPRKGAHTIRMSLLEPPPISQTPPPDICEVTIGDTPMVAIIDPEYREEESTEEEVSDSEWDCSLLTPVKSTRQARNTKGRGQRSRQLVPDRPLHMSLRSQGPIALLL